MNANAPQHTEIDHTIDRALSALRDAQPRSGLENRILASLEHRSAAPQPTRFHLSAHVALWAATSAAILAVTSIIILRHSVVPFPQSAVVVSEASHSDSNTNAVILSGAQSATSDAVILSDPERAKRAEGESKNPDTSRSTTNSQPFSTRTLPQTTQTVSSRPERVARSGEIAAFCYKVVGGRSPSRRQMSRDGKCLS